MMAELNYYSWNLTNCWKPLWFAFYLCLYCDLNLSENLSDPERKNNLGNYLELLDKFIIAVIADLFGGLQFVVIEEKHD